MSAQPSPSATPQEIEPELRGPLPRRVCDSRQSRRKRRYLWNSLPVVLYLVYFCTWLNVRHWERLQSRGVVRLAQVTRKTKPHDGDGPCVLDYRLDLSDTLISDMLEVSPERYDATRIGDSLPVTILPENPSEYEIGAVTDARVNGARQLQQEIVWIAVAGCVLVLWTREANGAYYRRLLRDGPAVRATITQKHRSASLHIFDYEYRNPVTHQTCEGQTSVSLETYRRYATGDSFTVLCSPRRSIATTPYFQLTKVQVMRLGDDAD